MVQQNKAALREQMKRHRHSLSEEERTAQSRAITRQVLSLPAFQQADTVFTYCSFGEEIDTYTLMETCLAQGKRLCLPRTLPGRRMEAMQVTDLSQLSRTAYGILEPTDACPCIAPEQIDVCLVPCLAADRHGYRLGYGGGYYDRFLPRTQAVRLLLCVEARLLDMLPAEPFDAACDLICTERRVIYIHEK